MNAQRCRRSTWSAACRTLATVLFVAPAIYCPVAIGMAADLPAVNLIAPKSLAGWDQGGPVQGWRAGDNQLIGSAGGSPLVSAWTFGDFVLVWRWNVARGATLLVSLPEVPSGAGVQLRLAPPGKIGSLVNGNGAATPIAPVQPLPEGTLHTAQIERTGDRLTVRVDDGPLNEIHVGAAMRFGLSVAAEAGDVEVAEITLREPLGESIFDGQDLAGWWSPLGLKSWEAKDGMIECLHKDGNYLRTEKPYGNFTLSLEYLASQNCNSGIGIRTAHNGWPSGDGFEMQIQDSPGLDKHATMAIYGNLEPLARADRSGEWNRVVVKADGPMISAWVNGQLVQQANIAHLPELKHRHPGGWIGLQDHGGKIQFRNLYVLAAPDGQGLTAWDTPLRLSGPELVCDRLLNPERLSLVDGITSGAAAAAGTGSKEQVLAELTGPGAVTQIARSAAGGQLAFYFDGESQPLIECPADELTFEIPTLFEQKEPVPTCLPYAKSLKIVLRQAEPTDYRIDYVTFPADVPVETFKPDHPVLPRGWLSAIDYRGHQFGWGVHREADPDPRVSGEAKSLDPGESATLFVQPGRGIVQWIKLQTNVALLNKDDLWLEVLIDGETEPAIAAPARYFFPSLIGGANHDNFLALFREGFTSMWAMPFAKGIIVRARNAGKAPLGRLAVTASVIGWPEAALDGDGAKSDDRLRLRGQFRRAGDATDWLTWKGSGRWVGLVAGSPAGAAPRIASVQIDGRDVSGWSGVRLDGFWGAAGAKAEPDFFRLDSGRSHALAWRYWQLAPLSFQESIVVLAADPTTDRLALVYVK